MQSSKPEQKPYQHRQRHKLPADKNEIAGLRDCRIAIQNCCLNTSFQIEEFLFNKEVVECSIL